MKHDELVREVIRLADRHGVLVHYCRNSSRCVGRGFPDLLLAGPGGVIFAELKTEYDDTSAEQDLWGWTLTRALPAAWTVWRREHLDDGTIRRALEEIACEP